jgi:hypothetical protein
VKHRQFFEQSRHDLWVIGGDVFPLAKVRRQIRFLKLRRGSFV